MSSTRALIGAFGICLTAVLCGRSLEMGWVPWIQPSDVVVSLSRSGVSAAALERSLTSMVERIGGRLAGIDGIESRTGPGRGEVRFKIADHRRWIDVRDELSGELVALRRSLPAGTTITIDHSSSESFGADEELIALRLSANRPLEVVRAVAESRVRPQLLSVPGVSKVEVVGEGRRELRATVAAAVRTDEAIDSFLRGFEEVDLGVLQGSDGQRFLLRMRSNQQLMTSRMGLAARPPPLVRRDEAIVARMQAAPPTTLSRIDCKPAVTLLVYRSQDSQVLAVARAIRGRSEDIRLTLSPGFELLVAYDRSENIREQLRDLAVRGGTGLALVMIVLVLMLRSCRAVGIIFVAVLVSLSCAIILFKLLGVELNVLTIAGFALLFGLVIDNAVVIAERLQVEVGRRRGSSSIRDPGALRHAVGAVWPPLLAGTLSTCAVFLPMVYLSGELRSLFSSFAILAALTLGCSLVASVVLLPRLAGALGDRSSRHLALGSGIRTLASLPSWFAARHPVVICLLLLVVIGLPTPLLPDLVEEPPEGWRDAEEARFAARYNRTIGSDGFREVRLWLDPLLGGVTRPFMKRVDLGQRWELEERPEVWVRMQLPPGSGIGRADDGIRPFEQEARRSAAVERTLVQVRDPVATLRVLFRDEAMKTEEPYLLRERLIAHALRLAGIDVSVSGLVPIGFFSGLGRVTGFTVHAYGPSYERVTEIARGFARRLERDPRVVDVDIHAGRHRQPSVREVIRFQWGAEATARTGLTARQLAADLRPRLWREAPDFFADGEANPRMAVRVVREGAERLDLRTLLDVPLAGRGGGQIRLADHAELSIEMDPPVIERMDQQYRQTLRMHYRGPSRIGREMLDREIAWARLPPGYRLERPRSEFFSSDVQRQFLWLIAGTIGLVFLVIAAVLESWRLAAVVMLSIPLAWIGIALGFLLTGQNFAEGAFIGIVLTVGIAVNDSILLADAFRRLRLARPAAPAVRLALLAVRQRLRPMWTTTLTSIAGMLPLLVLPDAGNFWVGLAVTVVGGLLASTLLAPAATAGLLSWTDRAPRRIPTTAPRIGLRAPRTITPA